MMYAMQLHLLSCYRWISSEVEAVLKGLEKDEPVPGRDKETQSVTK